MSAAAQNPVKNSDHFKDMLQERRIEMGWVILAENYPDYTEDREDGTRHFIKRISEYENRWLRVIVNVKKKEE